MRQKFLILSLLCLFSSAGMPWAQDEIPFLFRTSPFNTNGIINETYNVGKNDTIGVISKNLDVAAIDSLEIWSEKGAEGSLVRFTLRDFFAGDINITFNLGTKVTPINIGIFKFSQAKSLEKTKNGIRPGGKSLIFGFSIDPCLACKSNEIASSQEPLQFKLIFHHSKISDTLLVISDKKPSLATQSRIIRLSSNLRVRTEVFYNLLGRRLVMQGRN